MEQTAMNTATV